MEQLKELFESWGDIFSKESERPHIESYDWGKDLLETLNN